MKRSEFRNDPNMKKTTVRITNEQHRWVQENRPNGFSHIVREHIDQLMHEQTPVMFHNAWRDNAQKCYPYTKGGYCAICWPAGIPDRSDWHDYLKHDVKRDPNGFLVGAGATLTFEEWYNLRVSRKQAHVSDWNRNTEPHQVSDQETGDAVSNVRKQRFGWFRRFFG